MLLIHDPEERVRALDFHDFEGRMRRLLRRHYGEDGNDFVVKSRETPAAIRRALAGCFAGDLTAIDAIPVATAGTSFQREVWSALRGIRPGTLSYGALARKLDARTPLAPSVPTAPTRSPSWFLATGSSARMQALPAMAAASTANGGCSPMKALPSRT
jgi:O6-methylguanine-DNA--protein-cysteine methyltransferase